MKKTRYASLIDRSDLFFYYNSFKKGLTAEERARLNRALGIVQRQESVSHYGTTSTTCDCPDHQVREITCKHMWAVRLWEALH